MATTLYTVLIIDEAGYPKMVFAHTDESEARRDGLTYDLTANRPVIQSITVDYEDITPACFFCADTEHRTDDCVNQRAKDAYYSEYEPEIHGDISGLGGF